MQTTGRELADIDRRLDDAIVQLREQQALVALIDCERDGHDVVLSLLSSVLEQFYSLQNHRKAILRRPEIALGGSGPLTLVAGEGFEPPTSGL
jgi:hypothetical protein